MRQTAWAMSVFVFATFAHASGAASAPAVSGAPAPGTCAYNQPGVKVCSALPDGQGAFEVVTGAPAFLFIRTEEPIVNVIPPDPRSFQTERKDATVVIIPIRDRLPARTPAVITTKHLTVTLNIRPGSRDNADTQLTILDPKRDHRAAELAELTAELEPKLAERFHESELEAIAREGVDLERARGKTVARNAELIVLRAQEVVRVGPHRYLMFTVDNRSSDPFQVKAAQLFASGQAQRGIWRMASQSVPAGVESRGVIEVPATTRRGTHLKLKIEEIDPRRDVELPSLEMP